MKQQNRKYKDFERALKSQQQRYKKRVEMMLEKAPYTTYFYTFTFNDETLEKTNETTRLRYVKDFLIKQTTDYILNKDYGKENHREHYHAIGINKYQITCFDAYKYGYLKAHKVKDINRFKSSAKRTTAEKLTAHAFKDTTENAKIIYSRKQRKRNKQFKKIIDARLNTWKKTPKAIKGQMLINVDNDLRKGKITSKQAIERINEIIIK